ncbi:alpha/beta hydrolase [Nocardioides cavernaquae]|uniref:alpha/beta hydrolase n=1 Tax=Nocardioides cavernaquae TaxID=2321396 RepID=UPI001EE51D09|nr:alpha/beta hydrolase [Nocardioides cavernaquae]
MKRVVLAVIIVLVLLIPLVVLGASLVVREVGSSRSGSLGDSAAPVPSRSEDPGARATADPALRSFYDQELTWTACGSGNECSFLTVPLDYADPAGETIKIKVLRNPADVASGRIGNLLVNPGGPGAPGTDYAKGDDTFGQVVYDSYDIIGFDPRGTGESAPVDCLTDSQLDSFVASDPDPDTAVEQAEFVDWAERFGAGCAKRSGELARHVSTHEAARDMDVLRAVLGDDKLDYLGASYGTKLGATYADLFPQKVGRLVLDGAVDPRLSARDSSLQQAHGFQVAIEAYVDNCVEEGDCYLGNTRAKALARITGFLDQVDAEPIKVGSRELQVGNAFYGIILPLYNRDYWAYLDDALEAGLTGDGSLLLQFADLYTSRDSDGGYSDNSAEAIYAINCSDDPSSIPAADVPAQFADFQEQSPTFGRVFAWGLVGCLGLGKDVKRADWHLDAKGAAPIVVIGTTRDPATPLRWAQALASQLESGVLITRDGDGHTGYQMGNRCVDDAVEKYLVDGVAPTKDLTCS